MLTRAIRVTRHLRAAPGRVFAAWLDARVARHWLFATALHPLAQLKIDARVGGSFRCTDDRGVERAGDYLEIDAPRRLVFTLPLEAHRSVVTCVTVEFIGASRRGCTLELVHDGVPREQASAIAGRWHGMLYGLGKTLEALRPQRRRGDPVGSRYPIPAWRSAP